jgi:hypothetical protein
VVVVPTAARPVRAGPTELGDREINLVDQGDDMAAIVRQLGSTRNDGKTAARSCAEQVSRE